MNLNNKIDDFKFNEMFSKKIDNLESIINLYNESPKQPLQNLTDIYNNYQQFLIIKKKKEAREAEKRGYKMKYEQKVDMDETIEKDYSNEKMETEFKFENYDFPKNEAYKKNN